MVGATSAFRDADNKHEIVRHCSGNTWRLYTLLEGEEETLLIHEAIRPLLNQHHDYLHVDVGGGSTEVSLYTGSQKIASRSFDLGALRPLGHCDAVSTWETMQVSRITTQKQEFHQNPCRHSATGGNIRKLAQLAKERNQKTPVP